MIHHQYRHEEENLQHSISLFQILRPDGEIKKKRNKILLPNKLKCQAYLMYNILCTSHNFHTRTFKSPVPGKYSPYL